MAVFGAGPVGLMVSGDLETNFCHSDILRVVTNPNFLLEQVLTSNYTM